MHRHNAFSLDGILERAFTLAFRDLVYAQIWEDPLIDMEALDIRADSHVAAIASGGCNLLSYLTANPARAIGVDLNAAHIALNHLKVAALSELPDYEMYYRFVGDANERRNVDVYNRVLSPRFDAEICAYWSGHDRLGRTRITAFSRNIYRRGLLGRFIGLAHLVARLHGVSPRSFVTVETKADVQRRFDLEIAPIFETRLVKLLLDNPMSLYGLGIPPAQYTQLAGDGSRMAVVVRERLRKLLCDFEISDNYFAWQGLTRAYKPGGDGPLPPYLQREDFDAIRTRVDRVSVHQTSTQSTPGAAHLGFAHRGIGRVLRDLCASFCHPETRVGQRREICSGLHALAHRRHCRRPRRRPCQATFGP